MKITSTILTLLILTSFATAITLEAGETTILTLEKPFTHWTVVGNTSEVDLTVEQFEGNNVSVTVGKYNPADSFELAFFDREKEIVIEYHSSSSGGGSSGGTTYRNRDVNKTIYQEKEVTVDVPGPVVNVPGKDVEILPKGVIFLVFAALLIGLIMTALYTIERKRRKGDEVDEQRQYEGMQ